MLHGNMETLKLNIFWKYEKLEYEKKQTKMRHQLSQQLEAIWCVFEILYL